MKKNVQRKKHSEVSEPLNLTLSKIDMFENQYDASINQKAVRTFTLGQNSRYKSGTL